MICEMCKKEHNGKYGSGRFCSSFCARKFSTHKNRKEISERVSKKLKIIRKPCFCLMCNREISFKTKTSLCGDCSRRVQTSEKTKIKLSNIMKHKVQLGVHKGWKPNNKNSRFEHKVKEHLIQLGFEENRDFIQEYSISKNFITKGKEKCGAYRLDFYFPFQKIAIEIDGKQHIWRKDSDTLKDLRMLSIGIKVFRVPVSDKNNYLENLDNVLKNNDISPL
jgi:hypothetical protein